MFFREFAKKHRHHTFSLLKRKSRLKEKDSLCDVLSEACQKEKFSAKQKKFQQGHPLKGGCPCYFTFDSSLLFRYNTLTLHKTNGFLR